MINEAILLVFNTMCGFLMLKSFLLKFNCRRVCFGCERYVPDSLEMQLLQVINIEIFF